MRNAALLEELRRQFEEGFDREPAPAAAPPEQVLWVRAGGVLLGLPLAELAGIEADRPVVPLPDAPACLAAVGGRLVACYGLARALGGEAAGRERWLVLTREPPGLGFLFEELVGLRPLTPETIRPAAEGTGPSEADRLGEIDGQTAPLLRMARVVEALRGRLGLP